MDILYLSIIIISLLFNLYFIITVAYLFRKNRKLRHVLERSVLSRNVEDKVEGILMKLSDGESNRYDAEHTSIRMENEDDRDSILCRKLDTIHRILDSKLRGSPAVEDEKRCKLSLLEIENKELTDTLKQCETRSAELRKKVQALANEEQAVVLVMLVKDGRALSFFEKLKSEFRNKGGKSLEQLKQCVSRLQNLFPSGNVHYELVPSVPDFISAVETENSRLGSVHKEEEKEAEQRTDEQEEEEEEGPGENYLQNTLAEIETILANVDKLVERVDKFQGNKSSKEYLDIDHSLLQNIMKIDKIQINGYEDIRERRKHVVLRANRYIEILENKAQANSSEPNSESTA